MALGRMTALSPMWTPPPTTAMPQSRVLIGGSADGGLLADDGVFRHDGIGHHGPPFFTTAPGMRMEYWTSAPSSTVTEWKQHPSSPTEPSTWQPPVTREWEIWALGPVIWGGLMGDRA